MHIILSPTSNANFKEMIRYSRLINDVLNIVYKRDATAIKMTVTIDDASCNHRFQYTDEPLVHGSQKVKCAKCGAETYIHQWRPDHEFRKKGNSSRSDKVVR